MLFALIQKIVLYDDKVEIYYNYIKNPYPDNFSPEIDRDSSFIECSIVLQSGAPQNPEFSLRSRGFVLLYVFWTDLRVGAVLWEQNALPYGVGLPFLC